MPLTNPNKVVTEERLSEFYGQILPYMGGMPEILANKFSKSDLYSTDEKMIGQWIDGKPLYQKVVTGLNVSVTSSWTTINAGLTGTEQLIFAWAFRTADSTQRLYCAFDEAYIKTDGSFMCSSPTTHSGVHTVVLQYTKTTDSAISIGSDTDYSTTEKIVGTWIDGKPVYQRVAQVNVVTGEGIWTNILNVSSYNIDTLIHSSIKVNQNQTTSKGVFYPYTLIDGNNLKVYGTYNATVTHVILQYTKTS